MTGPARIDLVASILTAVVSALFLAVLLRVAQLQISPGDRLARHLGGHTSSVALPAPRGDILDRRGRLLATTRYARRLILDPTLFTPDALDAAVPRLAAAIDLDPAAVGERIFAAVRENEERAAEHEFLRTLWPDRASLRESPFHAWISEIIGRPLPAHDLGFAPVIPDKPRLVRYVRLGGILSDLQADAVDALNLPGVSLERVSVREYPARDASAKIVGLVGVEHNGLLGAELLFDHRLQGREGRLEFVRDVRREPLWVEEGSFRGPERGSTVRLAIDLELQRLAAEELARGVEEADAAGGRLVLLDPHSGEILAMVDLVRHVPGAVEFPWADKATGVTPELHARSPRPRYRAVQPDTASDRVDRNRCVEDVYEPGSTFKPFVWASVLAAGKVRPDEVFDTEGGHWRTPYGRPLEDEVKRATMRWTDVLVLSSNIGMVKGADRLSHAQLRDTILRFGFGRKTGLPLPGEATGLVTSAKAWSKYTQTSVAFGHEVAVTPIQMARAFCAFARTGDRAGTIPNISLLTPNPSAAPAERVLPAPVAELTRTTLLGVVERMDATIARANPADANWQYSMFGKSGTAAIPLGEPPPGKRRPRGHRGYLDKQYNVSFVAGAPAHDPRLVIVVVIDDPGPARVANRTYFGSHVAGPVARRVMDRALAYLGVPHDATPPAKALAGSPR